MVTSDDFDKLRLELSIKAKNGVDFILAASIVWIVISYIWTLNFSSYDKSIFTFIVGSGMLPLALLFSKILKTTWTIKSNPLQPLGLWLNFSQLFYFPFLIFTLLKMPDYFVMVYVIITGAHFFPYAWYYKSTAYAVMAGVISISSLLIGLNGSPEKIYIVPLCMSALLIILAALLYGSYKKRSALSQSK